MVIISDDKITKSFMGNFLCMMKIVRTFLLPDINEYIDTSLFENVQQGIHSHYINMRKIMFNVNILLHM